MSNSYNSCLNASNIYLPLRKTFEFIKAHQYSSGKLTTTEVVMTINLITSQFSGTTTSKQAVTDNVAGEIYEIHDTYVVLLTTSPDSSKPSFYYITYGKIIYLDSFVITNHFSEYVDAMNGLPELCDDPCNPQLTLINDIKAALVENASGTKYLEYIYDGIRSDNRKIADYLFVRNILVVEQFFLTPITMINGFALIPQC